MVDSFHVQSLYRLLLRFGVLLNLLLMGENNYSKNFPIVFKTPLDLLLFYDDDLREGKVKLFDWQAERLLSFSKPATEQKPLNIGIVACNGAGKSKIITAPCAAWMGCAFDESYTVITSASAHQLDTQTERYLATLATKANTLHKDLFKQDVWDIVKRKLVCLPNKSYIDLFATDEAGKAEGKHPIVYGGEFSIIVDEGKSIEEPIYDALDRCTGYTRRLDVSSPGGCTGHFFNIATRPELGWNFKTVTAFDCPNRSHESIQKQILKHGLHDPLIRSSIFAEFTSIDERTVIAMEALLACERVWEITLREGRESELKIDFGQHSGLDLSAGGDEMVLSIWDGNIMRAQETARYKNTVEGTKEIIHWIEKHQLDPKKIWADDGGIGRGIIDNLHEKQKYVNRVLNQHRAFDATRYANRGTELWFNFKRFVEENSIKLIKDGLLRSQLSNRYYKQPLSNKLQLESKLEAKAKGHPSPDRADACVLAWANYQWPLSEQFTNKVVDESSKERLTEEQLINRFKENARKNLLEGGSKYTPTPGKTMKLSNEIVRQEDIVEMMLKREQESIKTIQRSLRNFGIMEI